MREEREGEDKRKREKRGGLTGRPHHYVASMSAKPQPKPSDVKYEWFEELGGKKFLVLRFDGQNQTEAIVGWQKMDLCCFV